MFVGPVTSCSHFLIFCPCSLSSRHPCHPSGKHTPSLGPLCLLHPLYKCPFLQLPTPTWALLRETFPGLKMSTAPLQIKNKISTPRSIFFSFVLFSSLVPVFTDSRFYLFSLTVKLSLTRNYAHEGRHFVCFLL